jgi:hypothetical protein
MAKNIKPAAAYAPPHTMDGKNTDINTYNKYEAGASVMNQMNVSVGGLSKGNYKPVNPNGTGEMRGYGAATKGRKISGKMG